MTSRTWRGSIGNIKISAFKNHALEYRCGQAGVTVNECRPYAKTGHFGIKRPVATVIKRPRLRVSGRNTLASEQAVPIMTRVV